MKKNRKFGKILFITALIISLSFPIVGSAYSKSYSFNISHQVTGSTNHALKNKSTSTTGSGNTYWASGKVKASKSAFKVSLVRFLKSYSTSNITANGKRFSRNFGTVKNNNYNVRVTKTKAGAYGDRVKGKGTIKQ
ncbi:hypothetical protein [Virgibacillus dokdonensis]|uniref:Uncharacterized protein n=1 Tax=Virgibacillus dokdonensis TaxID=302167 RepID=A0A2K9IYS8_9BACI|nr:hypothetical protein [Virgibacillus dokdonensis]AUJ24878.1 hypothetical protein A21D_01797 [Virgibacillus dokdonensis]